MNNSQLKCNWPWFDLSMSKVKFYQVNSKAIYDLLYVFHTNLHRFWDISWNRSQMSKWDLSDLENLSYFRTGLVAQQISYMMQYIWAERHYYWIISIIIGKWAKPDISDLEDDLLNNSMKSISWLLINIIPKEAVCKKLRKVIRVLLRKLAKISKTAKFDLLRTFRTLKNEL